MPRRSRPSSAAPLSGQRGVQAARREKGNRVAASVKPLVHHNANRPALANPFKGQAWSAAEIRPGPTTGIKRVQAGAPVMDGGKVIGVLHAGITAD